MKRTIITCDGCGCEDFKTPMGFSALSLRVGVLSKSSSPGDTVDSFRADLCPTCLLTFNTRWNDLNPTSWPRAVREPMQQQEHTDAIMLGDRVRLEGEICHLSDDAHANVRWMPDFPFMRTLFAASELLPLKVKNSGAKHEDR